MFVTPNSLVSSNITSMLGGPWTLNFKLPIDCNVIERPQRPPKFCQARFVMKTSLSKDNLALRAVKMSNIKLNAKQTHR